MLSHRRKTRQQGQGERRARDQCKIKNPALTKRRLGRGTRKGVLRFAQDFASRLRRRDNGSSLRAGEGALQRLFEGGAGLFVFGLRELALLVFDLEGKDLLFQAGQQRVARR